MYKKIISIALSSMMLAQSVSAANLKAFVNNASKVPAAVITDSQFDYGQFRVLFGGETTKEIPTTVEALASSANENVYQKDVVARTNTFDFKVSLDMKEVQDAMNGLYGVTLNYIETLADNADKADLVNQFKNSAVQGSFKVEVAIDNGLTNFDLNTATLMQEGRTTPDAFSPTINITQPSANLAVLEFAVANGVTIEDLHSDITLLNDLYMIVEDVVATPRNQTLTVTAELTEARTTFFDADQAYGFIDYKSNQDYATVTFRKSSGSDGLREDTDEPIIPEDPDQPGQGGDYEPEVYITIGDEKINVPVDVIGGKYYADVEEIEIPEREGFVIGGIYLDPTFTKPVTGTIEVDNDTRLYVKYINVTVPHHFISDDHIPYIFGYPDGEVKPNANITREEVVAALYRLLKEEYKVTLDKENCHFPDVEDGRWSFESIAAFTNAGFIVGDQNGEFRPSSPITRAEFVTIIHNFAPDLSQVTESHFTDIKGHWAEDFIVNVANSCFWITGYEDYTFRPNAYITRAEAVTIINNMLVRHADVESELAKWWPDVRKGDWFYGSIIEATGSHDHTRQENGWQEIWSDNMENTDK